MLNNNGNKKPPLDIEGSVKRIIMARDVARMWLEKRSRVEYRIKIYNGVIDNLPNLLRSLRDKKIGIRGVLSMPDLGIKECDEFVEVWTSSEDGIRSLTSWLNSKGVDNDSIWT